MDVHLMTQMELQRARDARHALEAEDGASNAVAVARALALALTDLAHRRIDGSGEETNNTYAPARLLCHHLAHLLGMSCVDMLTPDAYEKAVETCAKMVQGEAMHG